MDEAAEMSDTDLVIDSGTQDELMPGQVEDQWRCQRFVGPGDQMEEAQYLTEHGRNLIVREGHGLRNLLLEDGYLIQDGPGKLLMFVFGGVTAVQNRVNLINRLS